MKIIEHYHADRRITTLLFDGDRLVVKARPVVSGGYLIVGYGLCLLDKKPDPTVPGPLGFVNPTMMHVSSPGAAAKVRRLVQRLAKTGDLPYEQA